MFVQLVGLPGAGKSTLAFLLEARFPSRFTRVAIEQRTVVALFKTQPVETLWRLLALAPIILYTLVDRHSPLSVRDRLLPVATLLNLLLALRRLRRAPDTDKIQLIEEFVYQRALGVFGYSKRPPPRPVLRAFLFVLRRAFVLPVFVVTEAGAARRRAEARTQGVPERLAGVDPKTTEEIYATQAILLQELHDLSPESLWVEDPGDLAAWAERIRDRLDEYRGGSFGREARPPRPTVAHFVFNLTGYGGAAQQALALARQMKDYDAVIFNVERRRARLEIPPRSDVRVIHLPRNVLKAGLVIARVARRHRIRIFHVHGLVGIGLLAGLALRKPLVLKTTLLGSDDFDTLARSLRGRLILRLARRVDVNVALSSAIAEINRRHLPAERVVMLPNAVSVETRPGAKRDPIFCCVGLVCRRKRTHLAIQNFVDHYASLEGSKLYIVGPYGKDPDLGESDEGYFRLCLSRIPEEHRAKIVFTGAITRAEVEDFYLRSLAILHFSESEGMPNAVLEAMAANCVPVTGEMGGVACEIIPNRDCGFVLAEGERAPDVDDLRACSRSLGPRRRAEARYALASLAERYSKIYFDLLP